MVGAQLEKAVADILDGHGNVTTEQALVALASANGPLDLIRQIKLWDELDPMQKAEIVLLDNAAPYGWWRRVQEQAPPALFTAHPFRWRHGERTALGLDREDRGGNSGYSVGVDELGDFEIRTPILDEQSFRLV